MPEKRLFKEDQERASASVTLVLHPDRTLTPRQARSVQHLVAAAVKGLEPDQVSVFANGNLLTTSGEQAGAAVTLEVKREMEERVQQDVRAILERRVGAGKVLVRVNMELSGREVKTRREELDADGQVVGSETVTEDRSTRGGRPRGAEGASGAAENLPGATGGVGTGSADNVRTRSRTVFQTPTTVTEVVEPAGRVERMTVAVLVDGEYGPAPGEAASATPPADASGDAAAMNYRPRSDTELAAIRELVIDAAGLDLDRGDRITVQSMQFADAAIAPKPGVEAVDSPWLRLAPVATRALVALVAIALVALLLVRPLVRWLTTPTPVTGGAAHALGDGAGRGAPAGARALTAGEGADSREPGVADHPDTPSFDVLNARELRAFAQRNMDRTVQVVREWAQDT
jgi:flagellar M-ring protein FliF